MKKVILLSILFAAILLVGCTQENIVKNSEETENIIEKKPVSSEIAQQQPGIISLEELAAHNKGNDCWVGYDGKVYDITGYIPNHKGGAEKIIPLCGTEEKFKTLFEGKHGTAKVSVLEGQGILKGDLK